MAWWNAGLARKIGRATRAERDDVEARAVIANSVVHDLYDQGVSLIALGEVLPATLRRIIEGTRLEIAEDPYMDVEAGIGVLFDPSKALVEFDANVDSSLRNRDVTRAIAFTVRVPSSPVVDLIVAHWPSRTVSEGADCERRSAQVSRLTSRTSSISAVMKHSSSSAATSTTIPSMHRSPRTSSERVIVVLRGSNRERCTTHSGDCLVSVVRMTTILRMLVQVRASGDPEPSRDGIRSTSFSLARTFSAMAHGSSSRVLPRSGIDRRLQTSRAHRMGTSITILS